jgi:RNA polymerase sigma factor (sigma-70 family)
VSGTLERYERPKMKTMTQIKEHEMLHNELTIEAAYATIDLHLTKLSNRFQRDHDDLRQDILLAVMERAVKYDPSLSSWATFQDRMIQAYLENYILRQRWCKHQSPESLDDIAEEEPQLIPKTNDVHSWEIGLPEQMVASGEVQDVIDTMPTRLRDCAELLKHYSPAETADMLNIPPNVLQRDIKRIRRIFEKASLVPF